MRASSCIAILALISGRSLAKSYSKAKDAVLLSNVRSLTLVADKQTSHRRVTAIPQLTCVGGNAKGLYDVDVMRCANSGSEYDAEDIQWTCQASLPPEFKLGSTEVVCEGYDNADDPYILKGSCGVEYRLILTDMGENKYSRNRFDWKPTQYDAVRKGASGLLNKFWTFLFWAVFIGIVGIVLLRIFFPQGRIALPTGGRPGWGGGGGGGYDDDPPPPYTPRAPPRSKTQGSSRSGPGFWSGAAAGAAAGYGASYYQNRQAQARARERERSSRYGSFFGGGGGPSSFGGGGGPSSSSAASPSSSRYEGTGFGGTRRR